MPRTRSLAWSELKIGILGVAAAALTILLVLAVGGAGGFFWQRYPLKTRFDDVLGLKPGAVVRLGGKEIGAVTAVEFAGNQVEVTLEVNKDLRPLITSESVAVIGSLSLLGEPILDIQRGTGGTPLPDWAYLKANQSKGALDELTTTAEAGLQEIGQLIAEVRSGRGTLGKLSTDDRLYNEMAAFVASARAVTDSINSGKGTLGGLTTDPAAFNSLKASLQNLEAMTQRINSGQGALGRLLTDDALGQSISSTMTSLQQASGRMTRGDNTLGKLLTEQALYDSLNRMTQRLDEVATGLSSGRGTAGQLLQDRALYENMNQAASELRNLLADIRKDPKKYLRVNVSIF